MSSIFATLDLRTKSLANRSTTVILQHLENLTVDEADDALSGEYLDEDDISVESSFDVV